MLFSCRCRCVDSLSQDLKEYGSQNFEEFSPQNVKEHLPLDMRQFNSQNVEQCGMHGLGFDPPILW